MRTAFVLVCTAVVAVLVALVGRELFGDGRVARPVAPGLSGEVAERGEGATAPELEHRPGWGAPVPVHWPDAPGQATARLEGKVVARGTGRPPHTPVTVNLSAQDDRWVYTVTSGADGRFSIAEVRWPVECDYACASVDGSVDEAGRTNLALWTPEETILELTIEVRVRSVVSGHVLDVHGDPIPGARVLSSLTRPGARGDHDAARAGKDGAYELRVPYFEIGHGTLRVAADAPGYFPAEGDCRAETPVKYTADFRLREAPRVRGRVVDGDGRGIAGADIWVGAQKTRTGDEPAANEWLFGRIGSGIVSYGPSSNEHRTEISVRRSKSGPDGRFAVTLPFPGSRYHLVVRIPTAPSVVRSYPAGRLQADDFDLRDIVLRKRHRPMSLQLVYKDGSAAAGVEMLFQREPMWLQVNSPWLKADERGFVRSPALAENTVYTLYFRGVPASVRGVIAGFFARDNAVVVVE